MASGLSWQSLRSCRGVIRPRLRQDAFDRPGVAGKSQLADDGEIARTIEGDPTAGQQQPQGDRQVEAVSVLLEVGRAEVDKSGAHFRG